MGLFKRSKETADVPAVAPWAAFRPDNDGELDDVVIKGVHERMIESVRFERMGEESIWGAVYFDNGDRITFNFGAEYVRVPKKRGHARIFYSLGERILTRNFDQPTKYDQPGYGDPWKNQND